MIKISTLYIGFSLLVLNAAGFDCTKAKSSMEKLICSNSEIGKLDSELGRLYKKIYRGLPQEKQPYFKAKGRKWIEERNRCETVRCVLEEYTKRVEVLSKIEKKSSHSNSYTISQKKDIEIINVPKEKPISNTFTFSQSKPSNITSSTQKMPSSKTIIATGYGIDKEKALKSAFKSAIEQYVGVLVDANTVVKNNKIIKDVILTASNGFIQSYDEISTIKNDGLIEVQIKALVKSQKVFDKIKSLNIAMLTFNANESKNIYARAISKQIAKKDAEKILKKSIDSFLSKESIKEMLSLGIVDVNINEEGIKNNKIPVTIACSIKINQKIYAQKVAQLEQTFKGLGAKLRKRVDLPYFKGHELRIKNGKSIDKLTGTDFGFIKPYGRGYTLNIWKFPRKWSDIYPFKGRATRKNHFSWNDYYNLILEIKRVDGQPMIAENVSRQCLYERILKINTFDMEYIYSYWSEAKPKIINPFISYYYNNSNKIKEKVSFSFKIWIDVEDIKDMGSVTIELDEI